MMSSFTSEIQKLFRLKSQNPIFDFSDHMMAKFGWIKSDPLRNRRKCAENTGLGILTRYMRSNRFWFPTTFGPSRVILHGHTHLVKIVTFVTFMTTPLNGGKHIMSDLSEMSPFGVNFLLSILLFQNNQFSQNSDICDIHDKSIKQHFFIDSNLKTFRNIPRNGRIR